MPSTPRTPDRAQPRASALVVFPWCLDLLGHGNMQRVLAFARYLTRNGVAVDLVYQGQANCPSREADLVGFRRVLRVVRRSSSDDHRLDSAWKAFYYGLAEPPPTLNATGALTMAVRGLVDAIEYSAIISTYAWTAPIFEPLHGTALRICDTQDVLHVHGARSLQATGKPSLFALSEQTERFLWRQWDVLLAISPEEAAIMASSLRPSQRLITMGHAVEMPAPQPPASDHIVYTASDNGSNMEAATWLLREVWPRVLAVKPDARLRIVGLICDALRATLLARTPNVELAGFVEDAADEVRAAGIVVAPYLYGSGLKIKVVEAAAAGRPVVTTSGGLEGTGMAAGEQLLVEDDPAAFARALLRLLDSSELRQRLGAAARQFTDRAFSEDACYGPLCDLVIAHADTPVQRNIVPPAVDARLRTALGLLPSSQVVAWGNGSHTRALIGVLQSAGATIRCIVDKTATAIGQSPEGFTVVPGGQFVAAPDDLIVLSSQTFEQEMWDDLRPARAAGVQVFALYRVDLITEPLQSSLLAHAHRRTRPSTAWRTGADMGAGRLIIVEPSAGRSHGPFFRLARAIHEAFPSDRTPVVIAGARVASLRGLEPEDHELLDRAFEFAYWDVLRETNGETWNSISRHARYVSLDLERLSARQDISRADVVLFHTANIAEMLGAVHWLGLLSPDRIPSVRLLFHFLPEQEAQWLRVAEAEVHHAYLLVLAQLQERLGDRLKVLAQTADLAAALQRIMRRPVEPMGFPVSARLRAASDLEPASPTRLLYAGEARADKGFGMLPAVADELRSELENRQLTLVCQSMPNEVVDDVIVRATAALKARQGVEVIDTFLPSGDYDNLISGCDLVLLPYDAQRYRSRLSAVFVDATCAGVLPIVPDHTWMSRQLAAGYGIGTTFDALTPQSIAAAVRQSLPQLAMRKQDARVASERVWTQHNPRRVLDTILSS